MKSVKEMVLDLAREHFELEQSLDRVVWFKNGDRDEIRLLEVNRETFPEGSVLTFYHGPTPDFPVPVILGDVTPEEWEKVTRGEIPLPSGWSLDDITVFTRDSALAERPD